MGEVGFNLFCFFYKFVLWECLKKRRNINLALLGVVFQWGPNCNQTFGKVTQVVEYVSLSSASFSSRVHKHSSILAFKDVDGYDTNHKPLRSSADK